MRRIVSSLTISAAMATATPAVLAQDSSSEPVSSDMDRMADTDNADELEMASLIDMLSGMFAIEPLSDDEEARLPAANRVAGAMMPNGFYGRMMEKLMGSTMRPMFDMFSAPAMIVTSRTGADTETVEALDKEEVAALARILDPAYDQRADAVIATIGTLMKDIGTKMEQPMRDGYARAFAKRFESGQLSDIEAFFATPSGSAFASESMALFSDPEVMSSMMGSMPAMFGAMGDMERTMEEAMAALPPEPQYADLTTADRARLTTALGIDEAQLEAAMTTADDAEVENLLMGTGGDEDE